MFGSTKRNPEETGTFRISKAGENIIGSSKCVKYFELITKQPATVIVNHNESEPIKARHVTSKSDYQNINNIPKKAEYLYISGMIEHCPHGKYGGVDHVCIKEGGIEFFIEYESLDTRS